MAPELCPVASRPQLRPEASFGPQNLWHSVAMVFCQHRINVLARKVLTFGSLLTVGILKLASVPAYLLEADCAPAQAAGKAPMDLVAERRG